ncbi:MAG: VWA domain-containing protein [Vicinamibacterales bacterium]
MPAVLLAGQPVFRGSVEAVRLDVSVMRGATPVAGLTADDFVVSDNGIPQEVAQVTQEAAPLDLLLVLDTSGSMAGAPLAALVAAAQRMVQSLTPGDRVGLVAFSGHIAMPTALTSNHVDVVRALGMLRAAGPTALRDALFAGLHLLTPGGDTRPVIVLFSDGRDTTSWLAAPDLEGVVRRSGVVLHAVELLRDPRLTPGRARVAGMGQSRSLQRAVEAGGGRLWSAGRPDELERRFASALAELRARYLVTYQPRGVSAPGWHEVVVRLRRIRADVLTRPGYFVPE